MIDLIIRENGIEENPRRVTVEACPAVIGRDAEAAVILADRTVSRRHAQIVFEAGEYTIEDLGSRNGLMVNSEKVHQRKVLRLGDKIEIGEVVLQVARPAPPTTIVDRPHVVQAQVRARLDNPDLFSVQSAPRRLQAVLELSRHLSSSLEPLVLFDKLLEQLFLLFPRADRATVVLLEGEELFIKAQRSRNSGPDDFPISGTIVRKALEDGVGILSQDVLKDVRFEQSQSLSGINWRSVMCVPLLSPNGAKLGVVQLASISAGSTFHKDELHLLTTLAMQTAVSLENLSLQAARLRELELRKELDLAREIQQSYLPSDFGNLPGDGYRLYARVCPARVVSGDLYDFFPLPDGRLAFFLGDVSGKGMPAALFMVAVHALGRNLALHSHSPAATLESLNAALVRDNEAGMFVTLLHGVLNPGSGEIRMCNAGHQLPLLRNEHGIEEVAMPTGALLGFEESGLKLVDTTLVLAPGDTLIAYTDGITEAPAPATNEMYGLDRFCTLLCGLDTKLSLEEQAELVRQAVLSHTQTSTLFDDLTLLMLQR